MPKFRSLCVHLSAVLLFMVCLQPLARSQERSQGDPFAKAFESLQWRSIGPANMGGRTCDVEGIPGNPNLVYVGTASGGVWKTTNGGTTWTPIFERQGTMSIGDMAVDPTNPDVVWVGTGESNTRNSVSFGDGVYKSNDGGKTWQHMGLRDSERISRIVINPLNPDIVYVGVLGHAFGPNPERGVFMTLDGGKTWQKTLYIDTQHGVADMDIDPGNPNILYAGMWSFERKPWTFRSGSENGGLFKSIDAGRTWKKLTNGLPKLVGRIGVKVAPSNTNVVYAMTEAKEGTLYRSNDRGESFTRVSQQTEIVSRGFYYTDLRVDPTNEERVYAIASILFVSVDGGHSFRSITGNTHIDYHSLWIDPKNPSRLWQAQDGGIAVSYDRGNTWDYRNNLAIGQFYQVHADNRLPFYFVSGGLQDNGGWTGPSRTREPAGILNDDWAMINFGDGFHVINHADDPSLYISESQSGSIVRTDSRTREQQGVTPQAKSQLGGAASEAKYRFHWNTPIAVSPHDKNTVFFGGNVLFKSTDFGKSWETISPDLTTNDPAKQKDAGGPISVENSSAEYYCTIISLAESPLQKGTIWVGTDDGNLQLTTDGGKSWSNMVKHIPDIADNSPVSHVEPSRANPAVAYVAFERHMFDDLRPYIFKTEDGGRKWKNIAGNLPSKAYVQVVREDPKNPNLLYAGTEIGLFATYNGGRDWIPLNLQNLPNVSVHDILVHPRDNDLIVATHGRSLWILDDASPIQQMSQAILSSDAHLFGVRPALRHAVRFTRYGIGDAVFTGANPPYGAQITYYLKTKPDDKTRVKVQVLDASGTLIREIAGIPKDQGLNRAVWDLTLAGPRPRRLPGAEFSLESVGGGPQAIPGTYTLRLLVGEKSLEQKVEVRMDPTANIPLADLQSQMDLALKMRTVVSAANDALRALDGIKEQLDQVEKTVSDRMPDAPQELKKAISDHKKQLESLQNRLVRPPNTGLGFGGGSPQFFDYVPQLYFAIISPNAAPTPAQREFFGEISAGLPGRIADVNRFLAESVAQLNDVLRRFNAPAIVSSKPVELRR